MIIEKSQFESVAVKIERFEEKKFSTVERKTAQHLLKLRTGAGKDQEPMEVLSFPDCLLKRRKIDLVHTKLIWREVCVGDFKDMQGPL